MEKVKAFVHLTRPVFLAGGALLYAVGAALAIGPIDWTTYVLGQALVTATQLSAQYVNEYFDLEADRMAGDRRTWLTGGSGILVAGRLAPITALVAARTTTMVSLLFVIVVAFVSGWAAFVGLIALAGAWAYSAPPARWVATPYGITAASVIVAVLTPLTGALVNGPFSVERWAAVTVPLLFLHHAMLLAFERPDVAGDQAAGKRTLSVRIGRSTSSLLHACAIAASFASLFLAAVGPLTFGEVAWALLLTPVGMLQVVLFWRGRDAWLPTLAVALFSATAIALLIGLG